MQQITHVSSRPSRALTSRILRLFGPALGLALALTMAPSPAAQAAPVSSAAPGPAAASAASSASSPAASAALGLPVAARKRVGFRKRLMRAARSKRGAPYSYGAAGPRAFDCSGYTSWVYRQAGRSIPRTSRQQAGASRRIAAKNRRRGDLVFFHSGGRVYHVAVYAGRGRVWHSARPGTRVHRTRIWTRSHFYGRFRR